VSTAVSTLRVIVAKPGLDGHDRGARVVARALRDAGFEVIYTGLHQTPEMILAACRQEDPDALLLSILSGAHTTLVPRILGLLREAGLGKLPVLCGGIIPHDDAEALKAQGVAAVMGPGTTTGEISALVRSLGAQYRAALEGETE
jgi:methylmalonyl-CoA mutase C-terminal domain/subunit